MVNPGCSPTAAGGGNWNDLDHNFYEVDSLSENDRVRYTVSPAARKDILKRLLKLNHERAAEQSGPTPAKKRNKKAAKSKVVGVDSLLSDVGNIQ